MNEKEFNLSFEEVTNALLNGDISWAQGEKFKQNAYLSVKDDTIYLETLDEDNNYSKTYPYQIPITKGLIKQKYREIQVLNYKTLVER